MKKLYEEENQLKKSDAFPGVKELDMNAWQRNIEKSKAVRSVHLISRLIDKDKYEIKDTKKDLRWMKMIYRKLKRLIRVNPDVIYIYDHVIKDDPKIGPPHWIDVQIAVPNIFRKLTQRWVCTLSTYKLCKGDQEEAIEYGWEYPILEPEYPENKFDQMYFDINGFKDDQAVIDYFREWMKYFLPELADKKIEYKELKSTNVITKLIRKFKLNRLK